MNDFVDQKLTRFIGVLGLDMLTKVESIAPTSQLMKTNYLKPLMQGSAMVLLGVMAVAIPASAQAKKSPPNVVIVITDDQGYGDFGFTGNTAINTPNIDKLRGEGVWM